MLAFGCTTDRNLGNGDPVMTPGLRTTPTGSSSPGSESAPTPPPMISSSTYHANESLAAAQTRRGTRLTADEAAAIMAQHQPRVRYLGVVSPGPRRVYESERAAMLAQQQQQILPGQYTINSSINSANSNFGAPAAITSGVGEVGSNAAAATFVDPNTLTGAATVATGAGTTLTPTAATFGVPSGTFAAVNTLSPTAAAVVNPPASVSGSTAVAATSSSPNTTVTATTISPTSAVNPVRIVNSDGRVTVTNTGSTRQQ